MQPIPNDKDREYYEEKERQRQTTELVKRTLTVAMKELFPVRKCSVSRVAARLAIREAYRFHRVQRNRGGATRPLRRELSHADEMERRKAARRTRQLV